MAIYLGDSLYPNSSKPIVECRHLSDGEYNQYGDVSHRTLGYNSHNNILLGSKVLITNVQIDVTGTDTEGDIYYRDSSGNFTRLAPGTENHVLTMGANVPEWAAAPTGTTNLGYTASGTALTVTSSTGNNVDLPLADTNNWGVMSDEMFDLLSVVTGRTSSDSDKIVLMEGTSSGTETTTLKAAGDMSEGSTVATIPNVTGDLLISNSNIRQGTGENQLTGGVLSYWLSHVYESQTLTTDLLYLQEDDNTYPSLTFKCPPTGYVIQLEVTVTLDASTSNRTIYADWTSRTPSALVSNPDSLWPSPSNTKKKISYPDETDDRQITYVDAIKVSSMYINPTGSAAQAVTEGMNVTIYPTFSCSATTAYIKWGAGSLIATDYPPLVMKVSILGVDDSGIHT